MPLTYGGVNLITPQPGLIPEMWPTWLHLIETDFKLSDLYPFSLTAPRGSLNTINWPTPWDFRRDAPVRINTLYYPTGASRWAFGTYLVAEQDLEEIRELAYAGDVYTALELRIDDDTDDDAEDLHNVTTDMFMLPPLPLAPQKVVSVSGSTANQNSGLTKWRLPRSTRTLARDTPADGTEPVYLVPLVDERYFWWFKAASVTIDEGTTTWSTLFASIATALGITATFEAEAVDAAYLKPPAELASYYEHLPLLLDAAAHSVGKRVVRKLDGSILTQGPEAALASLTEQLEQDYPRLAGGLLGLDV